MGVPGNANTLLLRTAAAAGGYQVSRSLRFNSADSAGLSRTFGSAGNRTTWTLSFWTKISSINTSWFLLRVAFGNNDNDHFNIILNTTGTLQISGYNTVWRTTTQVFRDFSAWYHFVIVADTNNGTPDNRLRLYVNGSEITTFSTKNNPSSGATFGVNAAQTHYISESNGYINGYLADIWFLDGIAATPSDFAETDATTGQWIPKTYSGSKGSNGFHLEFADNSAATATTLGKDTSGNSNNFSPVNFSVATGNGSYTSGLSGTFASGYAGINMFDGSLTTFAASNGFNSSFTWTYTLNSVSTLRIYAQKAGSPPDITVNSTSRTLASGTGWTSIDLTGIGSTITSITFPRGGSGVYQDIAAIEVNGIVLVDNSLSSSNDSLVDTPTSYGTGTSGGDVRGNFATWNPLDTWLISGSLGLANGNLDSTPNATNSWKNVRSTFSAPSGKWYYELTFLATSGNTEIGVFRTDTSLSVLGSSDPYAGQSSSAWVYQTNGRVWNSGSYSTYTSASAGDVAIIAFDVDAGKIWFGLNGTWFNSGNPASGTNALYTNLTGAMSALLSIYNASESCAVNFGQRAFAYTAPSGFKALCDTNLPAPVVAKPNTVMDVKLYTGNGSTQTVSNLGFSPDLVWIKSRSSGTYWHELLDSVRGANKSLFSNATNAEETRTNRTLNSDGFTVVWGSADDNGVNANSATYAAWAWDAGTSTVTNGSGSITSSVRANASAGFSIVSYNSGSSTGNFTLGHGLNVAPKFIIHKSRSTSNWWVYHASVVDDLKKYMQLNSTNAIATNSNNMWGGAFPTSSVFGVTVGDLIGTSQDAIAYVFSPVAGYSSFGSYTGNGATGYPNADGPFVYLGFRPKFVMWKCTSQAENWIIYDSVRDTYNYVDNQLRPNTSGAETTDANLEVDFLSNGFKVRCNNGAFNSNGATYVWAAWAESPFQYARAR